MYNGGQFCLFDTAAFWSTLVISKMEGNKFNFCRNRSLVFDLMYDNTKKQNRNEDLTSGFSCFFILVQSCDYFLFVLLV